MQDATGNAAGAAPEASQDQPANAVGTAPEAPQAGTDKGSTDAGAASEAPQAGTDKDSTDAGTAPEAPQAQAQDGTGAGTAQEDAPAPRHTRRPPAMTRDTARPEGGGRAAPGDAPAPARQWPLLTVLGVATLGLVVVGLDPFPQAPRIGAILIGLALLTGAALRRAVPSVGMLAVRSRFTDMVTYGLLGVVIVLLALMTQPNPWLEIPFLEKAVRFTVR
ncbi:DUF3017 domain-containing protein [Streptomyces sp. NPDC045431]|uniref:DUF3017 domain-containing protein n=1 Tax=Streptomyces sp. NPDC045431 TaxID=3155613 RepID=UPI0033D4C3A8